MTPDPVDLPAAEARKLSAQFERVFDSEPELGYLSETARRVLSVAAVLFYQQGSATTSVRDLTKACGLTPGALYNHFGSRDELLYVLVDVGHLRAERVVEAALVQADGDVRDALARYVRAYTDVHVRFPAFAQLVHREYVHLASPRRAEIVERRRRLRQLLIEVLTAGAEQRVFSLIGGRDAATGSAIMVLDMCSRTSEWFNPSKPVEPLSDRYVAAALRLVGALD